MSITINPNAPVQQATTDPKEQQLAKLRHSCREFEAIYVQEMYKAMRKTVPESGLFEKDMSSELYKEMLDMEMARATASGAGMGIGEAMYNQLKDQVAAKYDQNR